MCRRYADAEVALVHAPKVRQPYEKEEEDGRDAVKKTLSLGEPESFGNAGTRLTDMPQQIGAKRPIIVARRTSEALVSLALAETGLGAPFLETSAVISAMSFVRFRGRAPS